MISLLLAPNIAASDIRLLTIAPEAYILLTDYFFDSLGKDLG